MKSVPWARVRQNSVPQTPERLRAARLQPNRIPSLGHDGPKVPKGIVPNP